MMSVDSGSSCSSGRRLLAATMMAVAAALAVATSGVPSSVSATSSGRFIFDCDALSPNMGCDPGRYEPYRTDYTDNPSRNGQCLDRVGNPVTNGSAEMHWAFKAVRSDNYRVRVSRRGEAEPATQGITSYRPGEVLEVHVRVMQGGAMQTQPIDIQFGPYAQRPVTADFDALAYRGIMMHWEQSSDNNAAGNYRAQGVAAPPNVRGGWIVPNAEPTRFHLPQGSCNNPDEVLLHASGSYKHTYEKFYFRAPAAGTGTIALRVLLKSGDANWGWFWWPNTAGDIVLTEGADNYQPPAQPGASGGISWWRGTTGASCDDVCTAVSGTCVQASLTSVSSATDLHTLTASGSPLVCVPPMLSSCGSHAALGPTTSEDDACFFPASASDCSAAGRDAPAATTCAASSTDIRNGGRLCPCMGAVPPPPTGTSGPITGTPSSGGTGGVGPAPSPSELVNAASRGSSQGSVLLAAAGAAAAVLATSSSSASRVLVVAVLAVLAVAAASSPVSAHNWLTSRSRAQIASTVVPYPPRTSASPHVQVIFGQRFQVEHVLGHSRETYYVLVHNDHIARLKELTDADLDEYLADRPAAQTNRHLDVTWRRWHRRRGTFSGRPEVTNDRTDTNIPGSAVEYLPDFFASNHLDTAGPVTVDGRPQAAGDRTPRDPAFEETTPIPAGRGGVDTGNYYRLEYKDATLSLDARAVYSNPRWPWIYEVARTEHNVDQADRSDVLNFEIHQDAVRAPAPGHYIMWWRWRGYYDIIDIEVVPGTTPVANPYGEAWVDTPFTRVEHAIFANPQGVQSNLVGPGTRCTLFLGSAQSATIRCATEAECHGVNVVPVRVPASVSSDIATAGDLNPLVPWGGPDSGCDPADFTNAPAGARIVYAVTSRYPMDDRQERLSTTSDPHDLIFTSTAFARDTGLRFSHPPGSPFLSDGGDVVWRYGDKCVSCDSLTKYTNLAASRFVEEPIDEATGCRDCNLEPATNVVVEDGVVPSGIQMVFNQSACGGSSFKDLFMPGLRPAPFGHSSLSDCYTMVQEDPDCSPFFARVLVDSWWAGGAVCSCLRNTETACMRFDDAGAAVYSVAPRNPDPTCARGTRDTSGTRCCPAQCSQAQCDNDNTGVCSGFGTGNVLPERTCAMYDAPCHL